MGRRKTDIDLEWLQALLIETESEKLFSSPHKLFEAAAQRPAALERGVTWAMIYTKVREANADPDNPQIMMRTKSPRGSSVASNRSVRATLPGWVEQLTNAFAARGIDVTGCEALMTSSQKTREENRAVLLAWADLRDEVGCPKSTKESSAQPVTASEPVSANFVESAEFTDSGDSSDTVTFDPEPTAESAVIEVTEELPDGTPVPYDERDFLPEQTGEPWPEDAPVIDATFTEESVTELAQEVQTVPMSRPMPVRSPVPPRPVPAAPRRARGAGRGAAR